MTLLFEIGRGILAEVENALYVDIHDPLEFLGSGAGNGPVAGDAGDIHHQVHLSEALYRLFEDGLHALRVTHVALTAQKFRTAVLHMGFQLLHAVGTDIHADDLRALLGKKLRGFAADAGVYPGDHSDLIC